MWGQPPHVGNPPCHFPPILLSVPILLVVLSTIQHIASHRADAHRPALHPCRHSLPPPPLSLPSPRPPQLVALRYVNRHGAGCLLRRAVPASLQPCARALALPSPLRHLRARPQHPRIAQRGQHLLRTHPHRLPPVKVEAGRLHHPVRQPAGARQVQVARPQVGRRVGAPHGAHWDKLHHVSPGWHERQVAKRAAVRPKHHARLTERGDICRQAARLAVLEHLEFVAGPQRSAHRGQKRLLPLHGAAGPSGARQVQDSGAWRKRGGNCTAGWWRARPWQSWQQGMVREQGAPHVISRPVGGHTDAAWGVGVEEGQQHRVSCVHRAGARHQRVTHTQQLEQLGGAGTVQHLHTWVVLPQVGQHHAQLWQHVQH
mmetsp:Transcript_77/g.170  ORF Transcript_77/g.170 Transcript_77/m.170 type:complete len:372 (-) Transcript_77:826-1941(-)